jgi:hypothetical protein
VEAVSKWGLHIAKENGISKASTVVTREGTAKRQGQRLDGKPGFGVWLSLVERTVRVREVGSSNLPTPTGSRPSAFSAEGLLLFMAPTTDLPLDGMATKVSRAASE